MDRYHRMEILSNLEYFGKSFRKCDNIREEALTTRVWKLCYIG